MHQKSNYKDSFVNQNLYKNRIAFEEIKTVLRIQIIIRLLAAMK